MRLKRALKLVGLGAALVVLALAAGNSGQVGLAQSKGNALIIVGDFVSTRLVKIKPAFASRVHQRVANNIAALALRDFVNLGYATSLIRVPENAPPEFRDFVMGHVRRAEVNSLVVIAHGDKEGIQLSSNIYIYYDELPREKEYDYVILHACFSLNKNSQAAFSRARNLYGHPALTSLLILAHWQWLAFPPSGDTKAEDLRTNPVNTIDLMPIQTVSRVSQEGLELIDIEELRNSSAEEASCIACIGDINIPQGAKNAAKEAFIQLAIGHNALVKGDEKEAKSMAEKAIELLRQAYNLGWDLGKDFADELKLILQPKLPLAISVGCFSGPPINPGYCSPPGTPVTIRVNGIPVTVPYRDKGWVTRLLPKDTEVTLEAPQRVGRERFSSWVCHFMGEKNFLYAETPKIKFTLQKTTRCSATYMEG